ncbi:MAG: hypothetical protein QOJ98_3385 [Acidobacteriota bacterium]|jgi:hypothetical protein|nr:hypothetical protein [Acidobacteriota bacterium]
MSALLPFPGAPELEWVGARYTLAEPVRDGDAVYRPQVVLWLELPSGLLVGSMMMDPSTAPSFAETLEQTISRPAEGPPRRPERIRVADAKLAKELRKSFGGIQVVVAPVPELDEAFEHLSGVLAESRPEPSYLDDGEISPAAVAELFSVASVLFRTAPWRQVVDQQIVRVDIPEYGIDGACLSIIGAAGASFGLLLFRSVEDFDAFGDGRRRPDDGQSAMYSLSFGGKNELPPGMAREIEQHRWPVAGASGYPTLFSIDAAWQPLPVTERDVRMITLCTRAFLSFFEDYANVFTDEHANPVRVAIAWDDQVTVTLTAPYADAEVIEDVFEPVPPRAASEVLTILEMELRLVRAIADFASARFGPDWHGGVDDHTDARSLLIPWVTWTATAGTTRVADAFVESGQRTLSPEERDWCAAQREAWLSIWEVLQVEPGLVTIRDLLTGEQRTVRDDLTRHGVVPHDTLLARVVDYRGSSYFSGLHARPLPSADAATLIAFVREKVRVQKRDLAVELLRDRKLGAHLIDYWTDIADMSGEPGGEP